MPTAAEFEAFAVEFTAKSQRLAEAARSIERHEMHTVFGAVTLRSRVQASVGTVVEACRSAVLRCEELAIVCRRRAEVCRSYADAWRTYERHVDAWEQRSRTAASGEWVGPRPHAPARPAPWAERG